MITNNNNYVGGAYPLLGRISLDLSMGGVHQTEYQLNLCGQDSL